MKISNITTDRLILIPMTYTIVCSILNGINSELDKSGINLDAKWPLPDTFDILHLLKDSLRKDDEVDGFGVWMVVKKDGMSVIGDAGFKGEPNEKGEIEIGFGLVADEQKKGYGYETASALIKWALQKDAVKVIKADCLVDNNGSLKLLKKCGMNEVQRDNEMIYWELRK